MQILVQFSVSKILPFTTQYFAYRIPVPLIDATTRISPVPNRVFSYK